LDKCIYWKGTYTCLGCSEIDVLNEMECHVLTCQEINWNCNYCNKPIKRSNMEMHMESCNSKHIKCGKCKRSFKSHEIERHTSKDECLYSVMMEMKSKISINFFISYL
jgi:hypothetical protein